MQERFLRGSRVSEAQREAACSPAVKVYQVRLHPAQSHLLVLATSVGAVLITLPSLPVSGTTVDKL